MKLSVGCEDKSVKAKNNTCMAYEQIRERVKIMMLLLFSTSHIKRSYIFLKGARNIKRNKCNIVIIFMALKKTSKTVIAFHL